MRLRDTIGRGFALTAGIVYGAGMMYLLDPDMGRRRRALLRDKLLRGRNQLRRNLEGQFRNALHNLQGSWAEMRANMHEVRVPDHILERRVRAQLGHVVSHPGSLAVLCREGHVSVRGPVLAGERERIEKRLQETRGVHEYSLELRQQEIAGSTPGLEGESRWQRQQQMG